MNRKLAHFFCVFLVLICSVECLAGDEPQMIMANLVNTGNPYLEKLVAVNQQTITFLDKERAATTGLIESFHGSSVYYYDDASKQYYPDKEGILDQQGFTYDLALVVMVYTLNGQYQKAKQILKVLEQNFSVEKNGHIGLLNSYKINDFNGQDEYSLEIGIDGDRIHVGPNMWIALAALQFNKMTGTRQFLPFAVEVAKWAYNLPHYVMKDGSRGAVCMGSGWGPDWSTVFSTENIIDNYAVLNWLEQIYQAGTEMERRVFTAKGFGLKKIQEEKESIKQWLLKIGFNREYRSFNCGYNEFGVDKTKALDTVSWGISGIGPAVLASWGIDPFKMVDFAEQNFQVYQEIKGEPITGFDFTDEKYKDPHRPRIIWWEGTGQMIVMYQVMADYCRQLGDIDRMVSCQRKAMQYLAEMDKMSRMARLPYGVLPYTSIQPKDTELVNTFFYGWEIPRGKNGHWVTSLASTMWRAIGSIGFNPLVSEQTTIGMLQDLNTKMWAKLDTVSQ
ncbi:MAG: hypothetical protein PHV60_05870 [bacterium]|nr:hypothetical protein [bacterium]